MMSRSFLLVILCGLVVGCSSSVRRTRALLEQGNLDEAARAAGSNWGSVCEVAMAILESGLEQTETRMQAARAFEAAGFQVVPVLTRLVAAEDQVMSSLGASVLLRQGHGDEAILVALLRERLMSSNPEVRAISVHALGPRLDDEAFFRAHLSDPDPRVRLATVDAIQRRAPEISSSLLAERARDDPSVEVRARSLRALSRVDRGERLVEIARVALTHDGLTLRLAAIFALSQADDRESAQPLLDQVMADGDEHAQVRAAAVLASWGDERAREVLSRSIIEGETALATTAAIGAGQVGPEMTETLHEALDRAEAEVRLQAAASLLRITNDQRAIAELLRLLEEPGWIGLQAALILARSHEEVAEGRLSLALAHPDDEVRAYAARSCAHMPRGLVLAREILGDESPRVRLAAAGAILRVMARDDWRS